MKIPAPGNEAGPRDKGVTSLLNLLVFAKRGFLKSQPALSLRRRRSIRPNSDRVTTLEPRALMASLPVFIGPIAPILLSSRPVAPSPWLTDLGDSHPIGATPDDIRSGSARLLERTPRISGSINFLHPLPQPIRSSTAMPVDRPEDLKDVDQAPIEPPDHPRKSIAETKVLINGQPTSELAYADQLNGIVTVFLGNQVSFQVDGLSHPAGASLADIDNDGTPDLLIADSGNNRVLIYQGLGNGGFRPEMMGGNGITVGTNPVSLTVGDSNGDGLADLIVSNKGSNNVSILKGRGLGVNWSLGPAFTLQAGLAPVQTLLVLPGPGQTDTNLLICNKGSNNIFRYQAGLDEELGSHSPLVIDVGDGPDGMLVGRFDRHPDIGLVTVNSVADSLTYIGDVLTPHAYRQDITGAGFHPLSAIPLSIDDSGISDLMVANTDGRITFLQAGDNGLQLTGMIASTGLANITAIAAGSWTNGGLALYEVSSDSDSIAMLSITIDNLSDPEMTSKQSLPTPGLPSNPEENPDVEIVSIGGLNTDLAGILWSRTPDASSADSSQSVRDAKGSRRALQAAGLNQDDLDQDSVIESSQSSEEDDLLDDDPSARWSRYVLGLDAALGSFGGEVASLADAGHDVQDVHDDDWLIDFHSTQRLTQRESSRHPGDLFAMPSFKFNDLDDQSRLPGSILVLPATDSDALASDTPQLATATVGSAMAIRLLVKTSPPRPPQVRAASSTRGRVVGRIRVNPWPEVFPQTLRIN